MKDLNHKNIIKCQEFFEIKGEEEKLYIVMQHAEYGDLAQLIENKKAIGGYFSE